MSSSNLPPNDDVVQRTIYELTIIAKVARGQKLSASDIACINIVEPTIVSGFQRWRNGDSRLQLMPIIESRVTLAAFLANTIIESRHLMIYDNLDHVPSDTEIHMYDTRLMQIHLLLETLCLVPAGLSNLEDTYFEDGYLVYKLKYLQTQITRSMTPPIAMSIKSLRERKIIHRLRQQEVARCRAVQVKLDLVKPDVQIKPEVRRDTSHDASTPPPSVKKEDEYDPEVDDEYR